MWWRLRTERYKAIKIRISIYLEYKITLCNTFIICLLISSIFTVYCINIKTDSARRKDSHGHLRVLIDGVLEKTGTFEYDQVVLNNTCYKSIENITVQNKNFKSNDAWEGSITVTVEGEPVVLDCSNCDGKPFTGLIVVDGDSNANHLASTQCNNGKACTLTLSRKKGIVFIFDL